MFIRSFLSTLVSIGHGDKHSLRLCVLSGPYDRGLYLTHFFYFYLEDIVFLCFYTTEVRKELDPRVLIYRSQR